MTKSVKVTLTKSMIGRSPNQRKCIMGLGLKKIRQTRILEDTPSVRGLINKVSFMLKVENLDEN